MADDATGAAWTSSVTEPGLTAPSEVFVFGPSFT